MSVIDAIADRAPEPDFGVTLCGEFPLNGDGARTMKLVPRIWKANGRRTYRAAGRRGRVLKRSGCWMTGGLWDVYLLLNQTVDCPKGRGKLLQVFTGQASILVQSEEPKKRRGKKKGEDEPDDETERVVFCDPSEVRPVAVTENPLLVR